MNGEEFSIVYFPSYTLFASVLNMSINVSLKGSKTMDQSNQRLTSILSSSSRARRENIIKRKRGEAGFLDSLQKNYGQQITYEEVEEHANNIRDETRDPQNLVNDVMFFRKLLSNDHHPPIDLVISTGLVPRFVSFLNYDNCPSLQYEAAWVITNIASGTKEQTAVVIQCGALPILLRLIESPDVGVREQASWALGNIAGDNAQSRDDIINAGGVELILKQLNKEDCTSFFQKNGVWLLSNLCRTRDDQPTDFERVKICLPYMLQMLQDSQEDVVTDACWCFAFITDYNKRNTAYILQMGVLPSIVQLLSKSNSKVVTPALRTVGNVLAGDDEQTQQCLNLNVVEYLGNLLASSNPLIVKEAAWCLSNITAGTVDQVQVVINYDLIPVLVELIRSGRSDVQKEACWAVCNAFCGGNMMQIGLLVSVEDAIPAISSMLVNESGSKLISIIIDSLDRILVYEKFMMQNGNLQSAVITQMLSDCGCLDNIEKLEAIDESTYEKTKDFIERHFGFEDEISFNDIN